MLVHGLSKLIPSDSPFHKFNYRSPHKNPQNDIDILSFMSFLSETYLERQRAGKLVFRMPAVDELSRWFAVITALNSLIKDYKNNPITIDNLLGEMICINNRYYAQPISIKNRLVWLRCRDGITPIRVNKQIRINTVDDHNVQRSTKTQLKRLMEKAPECPVDEVLGIFTHGRREFFNKTIVFIDQISSMTDFCRNAELNDYIIRNIFSVGKIDRYGIEKDIWKRYEGINSLIIANNIYSVLEFINNSDSEIGSVIINGNIGIERQTTELMALLDSGIPVVLLSNYNKSPLDEEHIRGRIIEWRFIPEMISEIPDGLSHNDTLSRLNTSISMFRDLKIHYCQCEDGNIGSIREKLAGIRFEMVNANTDLKIIYYQLISKFNIITRLINTSPEYPDQIDVLNNILNDRLPSQKLHINQETENEIAAVINDLLKLFSKEFSVDDKIDRVIALLDDIEDGKTVLLVHALENKQLLLDSLGKHRHGIEIMTLRDLKDSDMYFERVIFSGWYGKEQMEMITLSMKIKDIIILIYPYEASYSKYLEKFIYKTLLDFKDQERWEKMLGINLKLKPAVDIDIEEVKENISSIELTFHEYAKGRSTLDTDNGNHEFIPSKFILFDDSNAGYFSLTHKFILIDPQKDETEIKATDSTQIGDLILFFDSDNDMIKYIADDMLKNAGKEYLIKRAALWKKPLFDYVQNNDLRRLVKLLKDGGLNRNSATIKNWIMSENLIGPGNLDDIDFISNILGVSDINKSQDQIKLAIRHVRSAHQQAGNKIRTELKSWIPLIIGDFVKKGKRDMEIPGYGKVKIRMIIDIGSIESIDSMIINKVMN